MKKLIIFFFLLFLFKAKLSQAEIIINKVMIGQKDGAKNEFVELYNASNTSISLQGYSLKKKTASGNESLLISNKNFSGLITPKSYFLISSPEFGEKIKADLNYSNSNSLAKNNTILLYDNNNILIDKIDCGEIEHDQVLMKKNDNNFEIKKGDIIIQNSVQDIITIKNTNNNYFVELNKITSSKAKDLISTEGVVSVLPNIISSQYFYIHQKYENDENVYGLQIYNYHKDFPKIKIGDYIKVKGEISINQKGEYRLKTKNKEDIEVLSSNNIVDSNKIEKIKDLSWNQLSFLKNIQGEIVQNKTNQIYLNDGSGEILIDVKKESGIDNKSLIESSSFLINGILHYRSDELKIIALKAEKLKTINEKNKEDKQITEIKSESNKNKVGAYLIIIISMSTFYIFFHKKIKI